MSSTRKVIVELNGWLVIAVILGVAGVILAAADVRTPGGILMMAAAVCLALGAAQWMTSSRKRRK